MENKNFNKDKLQCEPIGYFSSSKTEKYMAAKQPELNFDEQNGGKIILCKKANDKNANFEQAVADLAGFERIWILFWFHRATGWKPKVTTPRGGIKRGLFATRSPHRPNPIGLSCVKLLGIEKRVLYVGKNDLLDGTPILDLKPYLNYADAFADSEQGWIDDERDKTSYFVEWQKAALTQAKWIQEHAKLDLKSVTELRLSENPFPFPSHRIKKLDEQHFELAVKTWRILYCIEKERVQIIKIYSGYDEKTLSKEKTSRWDDVDLHIQFVKLFKDQ